MNLNELSKTVHAANQKWWQDIETGAPLKRNKGELLALIHSEISEHSEGEHDGLNDDKLPHRWMGEVELVDAIIRIFDYAAGFNHDLGEAGLKCGISEFINIDHIYHCASKTGIDFTLGVEGIHCQISRVLELERKGKPSKEVAEALVLLLILIGQRARAMCYDLQPAYEEKMAYNASRADHSHEARRIAGGKQF